MRASATATCLFVVLAVTAMVTFTAIAESRRRGHWCSSPRFVVTTYAAINSYEWRAAGRSAPRPPSLRVRHACIDFARHVHRLHLSRIRPSGPRLHNPLEHVRRPRLPPDSAPIQTSWSGAGVPLRGADAVVAKDRQTEMSALRKVQMSARVALPFHRRDRVPCYCVCGASIGFPLRCCPDRQELRFQVATTVSPDSRFWSYCYTRRRLWNWSKSER